MCKIGRKIAVSWTAAVLLLSVCGGVAVAQEKITLTFRQYDPEGLIGGLWDALEEFERLHPNITVEHETVGWRDGFDLFTREIAARVGPDTLQVAYVWTRDLGRMGGLEPLDRYIKRDFSQEKVNDFRHWEIGEYGGAMYGVPWTTDALLPIIREDLYREAGQVAPETYTELLAASMKLTKDRDGDGLIDQWGIGMAGGFMWFQVAISTWNHGLEIVEQDPATGQWRAGIDSLAGKNIMRYWHDFTRFGATPEGIVSILLWNDPQLTNGLKFGDYAMMWGFENFFVSMRKDMPDLPIKAIRPPGQVHRYTMAGGRELAINRNSKYKEEAWELLKFLTKKDIFVRFGYPNHPPQESIIRSLEFPYGERVFSEEALAGRTYIHEIKSPASVNELWTVTNRVFSALLSGEKSLGEAHEAWVEQINKAIQRGLE